MPLRAVVVDLMCTHPISRTVTMGVLVVNRVRTLRCESESTLVATVRETSEQPLDLAKTVLMQALGKIDAFRELGQWARKFTLSAHRSGDNLSVGLSC